MERVGANRNILEHCNANKPLYCILALAAFSRKNSLVSALRWLDYIFRSRGIVLSQFRSKSIVQSAQSAY